jgi:hypothetical protein
MREFRDSEADLEVKQTYEFGPVGGPKTTTISVTSYVELEKANERIRNASELERSFEKISVAGWNVRQILEAQVFWRMHHPGGDPKDA